MATISATKPPFWRDVRVLRVIGQAFFVVAVIVVLREIWLNLVFNLDRIGVSPSFDFLGTRAGFDIREGIDYSPNQSYQRAFLVGLVNTIRVAIPGVVLASVLGLFMGIARLSKNWLLRKIAQVYVEIFRNTPVLVVIAFFYVGVILALPAIGGGFHVPGIGFLSVRGMAVTAVRSGDNFGLWTLFLLAGLIAAFFVRRWRTRVNEETGDPHYRFLYAAGTFLVVAIVGAVVAGGPLRLDVPVVGERGFRYEGGFNLGPEYAAVLLGLVLYTGTFIAEIIRGSIQAVSKGQKEAAEALGLRPGQQLRLVVLPQAMRIAIPPLNSQYLNLTKNSTLGVFIGYPELASVGKTVINQAGGVGFQVVVILIALYLFMSLTISLFMNALNRYVTRRGAKI